MKGNKRELVNGLKMLGVIICLIVFQSTVKVNPAKAYFLLGVGFTLLCSWFLTFNHSGR